MTKDDIKKAISKQKLPILPPKQGRKKVNIDFAKLEEIASKGPPVQVLADYFCIHVSTLEKVIRKQYDLAPSEFIRWKFAPLKMKLLGTAIEMAIEHHDTTMCIFLLKNLMDYSDRREIKQNITTSDSKVPKVSIVLPGQIEEKIETLKKIAKEGEKKK